MSKVYFSTDLEKILGQIDYSKLGNKVAIKVHFGEMGCNTYLNPGLARKVYEKIKSLGKEAALVECNVLYKGSRVNKADHIKTAADHGFTDMEIDILDGKEGRDFVEINGCKIGADVKNYDSLLVLTHFKGHGFAGFGGSIKNVGMGLGSRAGKLYMHSTTKPYILEEKCIGCGICLDNCNANAISLSNGKAKIDEKLCEGCAMCIAVCSSHAASVPWQGGSTDDLQRKIAEYTTAVLSIFPNAIFINVLQNITKQCDCMGIEQEPMMEDVGILYSEDIVAIDRAGVDLADKYSAGKFSQLNSAENDKQIEHAEKLGLGTSNYELMEI